jgi:hypothetical protein
MQKNSTVQNRKMAEYCAEVYVNSVKKSSRIFDNWNLQVILNKQRSNSFPKYGRPYPPKQIRGL